MLYCIAFHCIALHCIVLYILVLYCLVLHLYISNTIHYNAMQCNAIQNSAIYYIYIIADHMQMLVFTLKTTSKTATRTASSTCSFEKIPLHLIPFSLILLELKAHCSGYVVFKTSTACVFFP